MKSNILFVVDRPRWAYDEIFNWVHSTFNTEECRIDVVYCNGILPSRSRNILVLIKDWFNKRSILKFQTASDEIVYDKVIFLGFYMLDYFFGRRKRAEFPYKYKACWIGIYTDGFPPKGSIVDNLDDFKGYYFGSVSGVICGSLSIYRRYRNLHHGVYYANVPPNLTYWPVIKKDKEPGKFCIGWTGNPERMFKGYYSHILPAIEILRQQYPNIQFKSRFGGPYETLYKFYSDVDVVVIASDADAGPSLFAEASLSSVPCVSTKVGAPLEVIVDGVNGFLISKDVDSIVEKVSFLYENPSVLDRMSARIRQDFLSTWGNSSERTKQWKEILEK